MRIAFFGSGSPLSAIVLSRLAEHLDVVAVVVPESRHGWRSRLRRLAGRLPDNPLVRVAKQFSRPVLLDRGAEQVRRELIKRSPELVVVASYPSRIPASLLAVAERGGVNLHQSLLPKGRGPDPIFWSYYNDDRETGSSVHWLDERFDHGPIIAQRPMAIARGQASTELYLALAETGGQQLVEAIKAIQSGEAFSTPQDDQQATYYGSPLHVRWRVLFDSWSAERTWHFLAGVGEAMGSLCRDPAGNRLPLGAATSFSVEAHGRNPGTYETTEAGLRLFCCDGFVEVARPHQRAMASQLSITNSEGKLRKKNPKT